MKRLPHFLMTTAALIFGAAESGMAQSWNQPASSPYYTPGTNYYSGSQTYPSQQNFQGYSAPQLPANNSICGPNGCDVNLFPNSGGNFFPASTQQFNLPQSPTYDCSQGYCPPTNALPDQYRPYPSLNSSPVGYQQQIPANMWGISQLPVQEQQLALQQRVCPVSGELLGSRGMPVRVVMNGRTTYVCCQSCANSLQSQGFSSQQLIRYQPGNSYTPNSFPALGTTLY